MKDLRGKKITALLCAFVMALSAAGASVFAEDTANDGDNTQVINDNETDSSENSDSSEDSSSSEDDSSEADTPSDSQNENEDSSSATDSKNNSDQDCDSNSNSNTKKSANTTNTSTKSSTNTNTAKTNTSSAKSTTQKTTAVKVTKVSINKCTVTYKLVNNNPVFTVKYKGKKLVKNKDYKISIKAAKKVKNAVKYCVFTCRIRGINTYTGLRTKTIKKNIYLTSKAKPGIVYLKSDTIASYCSSNKKRLLRKGYYTGYQISNTKFYVKARYSTFAVPVSKCKIIALSNSANHINLMGAVSQLGEYSGTKPQKIWCGMLGAFVYGCGPTCVSMLVTHEMGIVKGLTAMIGENIYNRTINAWGGSSWGYTQGTPNYGNSNLLSKYAKLYSTAGKRTVTLDTYKYDAKKKKYRKKTRNELKAEIDAAISRGHSVIICVHIYSKMKQTTTVRSYTTSKWHPTHYVVIAGETGGNNGSYYIADPWYGERSSYLFRGAKYNKYNGYYYYYGLERRSKTNIVDSVLSIKESYLRGCTYVTT